MPLPTLPQFQLKNKKSNNSYESLFDDYDPDVDYTKQAIESSLPAIDDGGRSFGEIASDTAVGLGKSVVDLGGTAYNLADLATGGNLDQATQYLPGLEDGLSHNFERTQGILDDFKSDKLRAKEEGLGEAVNEGFLPTLKYGFENPEVIGQTVAESATSLGAVGAIAKGGAKYGAKKLIQDERKKGFKDRLKGDALKEAKKNAMIKGSERGALGGIVATEAGSNSLQAKNEVLGMDFDFLAQNSPDFNELLAQNETPENARRILADRAARETFAITAPIAGVAGKLAAPLEGKLFMPSLAASGKGGVSGAVKGGVTGAAREGGEEVLQSGGGAYASNQAIQDNADVNRDVMQGVAGSAGLGLMAGAAMGGPMGAVQGSFAEKTKRNPEDAPVMDDQGNQVGWQDQATGERYSPIDEALPMSDIDPYVQANMDMQADINAHPRTPDEATGTLDKALLTAGIDSQQQTETPLNIDNDGLPSAQDNDVLNESDSMVMSDQDIEVGKNKWGESIYQDINEDNYILDLNTGEAVYYDKSNAELFEANEAPPAEQGPVNLIQPQSQQQTNLDERRTKPQHEQQEEAKTEAAQETEAPNIETVAERPDADSPRVGSRVSFQNSRGKAVTGEVVDSVNDKALKVKLDLNGKTVIKQSKILTPEVNDNVSDTTATEETGNNLQASESNTAKPQEETRETIEPISQVETGQKRTLINSVQTETHVIDNAISNESDPMSRSMLEGIKDSVDKGESLHDLVSDDIRLSQDLLGYRHNGRGDNSKFFASGPIANKAADKMSRSKGKNNKGDWEAVKVTDHQWAIKPVNDNNTEITPDIDENLLKTEVNQVKEENKDVETAADTAALSPNNDLPEPGQAQIDSNPTTNKAPKETKLVDKPMSEGSQVTYQNKGKPVNATVKSVSPKGVATLEVDVNGKKKTIRRHSKFLTEVETKNNTVLDGELNLDKELKPTITKEDNRPAKDGDIVQMGDNLRKITAIPETNSGKISTIYVGRKNALGGFDASDYKGETKITTFTPGEFSKMSGIIVNAESNKEQADPITPKEGNKTKERIKAENDFDKDLAAMGDFLLGLNSMKVVPDEQRENFTRLLTNIMSSAFKLGYVKFKDNAKYIIDTVTNKFGAEAAENFDLQSLQGSYIAMSSGRKDVTPMAEVVQTSIDEVNNTDYTKIERDQVEETENVQSNQQRLDQQEVSGNEGDSRTKRDNGNRASERNDTERLESEQTRDVSGTENTGDSQETGVRATRDDVAGNGVTGKSGLESSGRENGSVQEQPNVGARGRTGQPRSDLENFHIDNPKVISGGTPVVRFNKNKASIELYTQLKDENRNPTSEEQAIIAGYTGWGSYGQELFQGSWDNPRPKKGWEERDQWLRDHLGESQWKSAQNSIINAHYTDANTITAMWNAAEKMGFKGGRVLEPAMGIGNFFGIMPKELKSRSQLTGIELDELTGGMAQMLYPQSNISVKGYQESKTPDNFYDIAISNVPFANFPIADRKYQKLNPNLHDYFFLKMVDQVRPGGLVMAITSKGTMDKIDPSIRRALAKKAELVGSIRLPSGAFQEGAGTKVVTDIIILKKRDEALGLVDDSWIQSKEYTKTPNPIPQGEKISVNQYFHENPKDVLGTINYGHGTTFGRAGMLVDMPKSLQSRLNNAIKRLPENIYTTASTSKDITYITNHTDDRQGSLTKSRDDFYIVNGEHLATAHDVKPYKIKSKATTELREDQFNQLIEIRKAYAQLIQDEQSSNDAETSRKTLNKLYKTFVSKHGHLNGSFGLTYMRRINDPFFTTIAALEVDSGTKEKPNFKPAKILTESTIRPQNKIENPSVSDAYVIARNQFVSPNLKDVASIANKSEYEIRNDLVSSGAVFLDEGGDIIPADVYLSGNVKVKLRSAQQAVKDGHKELQRNIDALLKVVPKDIPYHEIEAKLGASWIKPEIYESYVKHMLNEKDSSEIKVTYRFGKWKADFPSNLNYKPEAKTGFGTPVAKFKRLVNYALTNQLIKIYFPKDSDGVTSIDQKSTDEANQKIANIREEFSEWVWSDPERRIELENEYNEVRNAYAEPDFDGSFLSFQGMALQLGDNPFNLRKHQVNAIWRAIVKKRSLNAHEVGTGKTFTLGGIAVESRRYGIAKKPVILAHNANSAAVASEIQVMYPGAKVLYVDNLDKKNIKLRMQQIANDDWDAIVMPHSQISNLSLKEDTLMAMAAEEIEALEIEAKEAAEEDGITLDDKVFDDEAELIKLRSVTAKNLVKERNKIIESIKKQSQKSSREDAISFEDLGIDMIMVDEAHEFKKPPIVTKMKMKGFNAASSNRSIALRFLTKYVRNMNNGGNVHLFTGTPITNTLTEIYHQQRYLMEEEMAETGVDFWDGWFGSFASEVQDIEQSSSGEFEDVTRLAAFINIPELRKMIGQYMDVVFSDDMPEMQPRKTESGKVLSDPTLTDSERNEIENGRTEGANDRPYKKIIPLTQEMSDEQLDAFEEVKARATRFKQMTGKQKKEAMMRGDEEVPIIYEQYAEKASFDIRLLRGAELAGQEGIAEDTPNSKASRVIANVLEIYNDNEKSAQAIFMDKYISKVGSKSVGKPGNKKKVSFPTFSVARDIKERLIKQGIPREEIAIVDLHVKGVKRKEIADKMNTGEIRVVIGSSQSLGVGVNMQKNLRALHHLDAPWMPGELEQRNGRGHRQGNQWNTVLEYRYLTDRIDGRRWQVLAKKAKFINQFMRSKGEIRNLEGDAVSDGKDDILDTFAEAAGDPRILLKEQFKKKIKKFERKERLYSQSIADAKSSVRGIEQRIEKDVDQVAENRIEREIAQNILRDHTGESFTATIKGRTYDKRAKATKALDKLTDKVIGVKEKLDIGTVYGYPAFLYRSAGNTVSLSIKVDGRVFSGRVHSIQSLDTGLRNTGKAIEKDLDFIEQDKASLERLKQVSKESFKDKDALDKARVDFKNIEQDMRDNPNPPPVWLRNGAPTGTDVFVGGEQLEVTGHRWTNDGYFIVADDSKGKEKTISYTDVKDNQGMNLYEEVEFKAPDGVAEPVKEEGEQDPSFSRAKTADIGPTLSHNAVESIVNNVMRRFKTLPFEVVSFESALPKKIQQDAKEQGATGEIKAVYWRNKVYVVSDKFHSDLEVEEAVLHEVTGHYGSRVLYGKDVEKSFKRLYSGLRASGVRKIAKDNGIDLEAYIETSKDMPYEQRAVFLVDELLAHLQGAKVYESLPARFKRLINEFIGAIRHQLKQKGFANLSELSNSDLAYLLKRMNKAAETGKAAKKSDLAAFMTAYHGTPHEVDEFSTGKIGTGEGAQAQGWGMYFAGEKGVAEFYRDKLSGRNTIKDSNTVEGKGNLYGVDLKPEQDQYLDWDKPLTKQSKHVKDAIINMGMGSYISDTVTGRDFYNKLSSFYKSEPDSDWMVNKSEADRKASEELLNAGIRGNKYMDAATRLGGNGNYNYVIFDDADIEITTKFSRKVKRPQGQSAEESFLNKINPDANKPSIKEKYAQFREGLSSKIRQGMVDRYDALFELDKKAYGSDVVEENTNLSSWVLAKMSSASEGAVHAMLDYGRIKMDMSGAIDMRQGDQTSLVDTLKQLGSGEEINRFMGWMAANRASKLLSEGRENLFTPNEIAAGMKLNKGKEALYKKTYREFNQFQTDVLNIAKQSGIISKQQAEDFSNEMYVPFYRVMDDDQVVSHPMPGDKLVRQQAYKKLKGGNQALNDLLENTLVNFNNLISASLKNNAAKQATSNAVKVEVAEKTTEASRDKKSSTFVMRNGDKVWYNINDQMVYNSLTALTDLGMNQGLMKVMRKFKRVFTSFTTASPQFIVANLLRDSVQAAALGKMGAKHNAVTGALNFNDKNKAKHRMIASGGAFSFGHIYMDDPDAIKQSIDRELTKGGIIRKPKDINHIIRQGWDKYQSISNRAENANRMAIYEQAIKDGKSHQQAAFESRDLMDFSSRGEWAAIRVLTDIVPFLNARMVGLDVMNRKGITPTVKSIFGKGTTSNKVIAARFSAVQGAVIMASMALFMAYKDDEDFKARENWDRDTYWWFKVGDSAFKIPKPFEIGAIGTMAERTLEQFVDDKATGKLFAERFGHMLSQTFSFNPMPQMFKPAYDVYSNRDSFTGRQVESVGMKRLSHSQRIRSNTTSLAKITSNILESTFGEIFGKESSLVLSPVQVDYLIQNYLGWVGSTANSSVDGMINYGERPEKYWHEYQPVKRFYQKLPSQYSKYITQFYDNMAETNRIYADINNYKKLGELESARELFNENKEKLRYRKWMNRVQQELTKANNKMKIIRNSNKTKEEKRRLIDIQQATKKRLTKMVVLKVQG